jgi:hypothetical protein
LYFLLRLLVATAFRDLDAFAVGRERLVLPSRGGERLAQQLPRRGVVRIELDRAR